MKETFPLPVSSQFDYYNSMLINSVDEDGNYVDLGGEFPLEKNEHFNKLLVNTQQSNIQIPTNVYNRGRPLFTFCKIMHRLLYRLLFCDLMITSESVKLHLFYPCADPYILNAIYNSEALNDVFISNFQKDPTLTWQYFGSSTGFFRIYPGEFTSEREVALCL